MFSMVRPMKNNIGLVLAKRAQLNRDLEAVIEVERERRFTYGQVNARANRIAHALQTLGVRKGDRVALLMMNGVEYFESFFAIAKIGAIVVPLNWRLVADELAFILKDSGATVAIYDGEFADVVADLHQRGAEDTAVTQWVHVGKADSRAAFAASYDALQDAASDAEPDPVAEEHDELYIMYTSGTTGLPKGAVHTHASALWACITSGATADVRYLDRYVVVLPLFHVGALTPLTGNVYKGATSVIMRAFDPTRLFATIEQEKITVLLAVPAMLNFMLLVPEIDTTDLSTLRWIMSGAAPVPVTLIEAWTARGIPIHQVYGLTETCGPACLTSPEEAVTKAGSTGRPFFHTDVRVVDSNGTDVKAGETGEVIIRGAHIMKEYWNRPEATAEAIRDGWLHSGDLATIDEDGLIYIQDRKKDMIISGGENVYPAEIENVILSHPRVREVAVVGQASAKWGESPLAIVVKDDDTLVEADVLEYCRGKLARFKLPKGVRFIEEIPRNPAGKILKRILRERFPEPAGE